MSTEFLKHMQCGAEKGLVPQRKCIQNHAAQMEWITENIAKEERVLTSCCAIHWLHHCIVNATKSLCPNPEAAEYFDKSIGGSVCA